MIELDRAEGKMGGEEELGLEENTGETSSRRFQQESPKHTVKLQF